jgi:hypothetical protein
MQDSVMRTTLNEDNGLDTVEEANTEIFGE